MGTILFNHIIFGPIKSRRLGNSLGVNLLPKFGKWCSFDCIYCECGWNKDGKKDTTLPTKEEVFEAMSTRLHELSAEGTPVDTITFSGNGEPTMHPAFAQIIDFTLQLRDKLYPSAKVSVLTNASQLGKKEVRDALQKIDNPILKIDSPLEHLVEAINIPNAAYKLKDAIENIKLFNHNFILQTMFLKGVENGVEIDCTCREHVEAWQNLVRELAPREVMMYTIDRETPAKNLQKVSVEEMEAIAAPLVNEGFKIQIRG
ncbi:MAG: radical SAM protein [Bacteroidales bacterium]|jgi:wyosine [tRNA(Phe)-imidazoG37] synthetase (radical SAM superfamily)|nr:radical SAM protein [Bacteroidales bacterium]